MVWVIIITGCIVSFSDTVDWIVVRVRYVSFINSRGWNRGWGLPLVSSGTRFGAMPSTLLRWGMTSVRAYCHFCYSLSTPQLEPHGCCWSMKEKKGEKTHFGISLQGLWLTCWAFSRNVSSQCGCSPPTLCLDVLSSVPATSPRTSTTL